MKLTYFDWKGLLSVLTSVVIAWAVISLIFLCGLLFVVCANAAERDYQIPWCAAHNGKTEVIVKGGRVDCLTPRYAVEVDYAPKWKECIAQARWYGLQTGRIPGCVLIVGPGQGKYLRYVEDYLHGTGSYVRVWEVAR